MASRLLRTHMVVAVVAVAGFLVVPDGMLQTAWQVGVGWFATVMIILGVRQRRPLSPATWWLIAAGVAGNAGGIAVEAGLLLRFGDVAYPSLADVAYLSL